MIKFFKCDVCGKVITILDQGEGIPTICCGQEMKELIANTSDGAKEKHVPVIEKTDNGFKVRIGELPHPMESQHYITFISVHYKDGKVGIKFLSSEDTPEAEFFNNALPSKIMAYCNLHGLWMSENIENIYNASR